MLIFLVCEQLSRVTEIPDGIEHSEHPLGILVDVGYDES
jgi:hypothetical protein